MHISLFLIEIYGVSFADRCGSAANKISLSITLMQQIGSRIEISVPLNFIFHERILFMGRKMSIPLNKLKSINSEQYGKLPKLMNVLELVL
ncbi:hypothetical protein T4B_6460 [Trichinella pseudospiralis]|uniref:Uncharacterized protein n=1 Tax=Trichinella pseudospiralis TaxID=6337 RepID=A0A0V1IHV1_TRIPS|nr:hypothetical protein T4B_6460 [Trichinella pseudospiralis]